MQSSITPRYKAASGGRQGMAEWLLMWGTAKQYNIPYFLNKKKAVISPLETVDLGEFVGNGGSENLC